jgi:hypothetical protein
MHRGCVPFVAKGWFDSHYWPTLRPIVEELWKNGHQTLFYAEGDWSKHLHAFSDLPERSIVYHVDKGDIREVHCVLGGKFCLSGGIRNDILAYGTPDDVRACCKSVIDGVARDGGYIMDASAIMQNDTRIENLQALTEFTRDYGVYSSGASSGPAPLGVQSNGNAPGDPALFGRQRSTVQPGLCIPWEVKRGERPEILGDETLARRIWEEVDGFGHTFIWHCLVSF